jgi:hypothetical protein
MCCKFWPSHIKFVISTHQKTIFVGKACVRIRACTRMPYKKQYLLAWHARGGANPTHEETFFATNKTIKTDNTATDYVRTPTTVRIYSKYVCSSTVCTCTVSKSY